MDDGSIGTDAVRVQAAIERAMSDDGVLVLMDLGSALMSAEMAVELMEGDGRVVLSEAPLVEGAVAAAAAARGGASLDEVRAEAGRAFAAKQAQLGVEDEGPSEPAAAEPEADARAEIPVVNEIGLHARPAALVVELAGRFDADLRLAKEGAARAGERSEPVRPDDVDGAQGRPAGCDCVWPAGRRRRGGPRGAGRRRIRRRGCGGRRQAPSPSSRRPRRPRPAPPSRAPCCVASRRRQASRSGRPGSSRTRGRLRRTASLKGPRSNGRASTRRWARLASRSSRTATPSPGVAPRRRPRSSRRTSRCSTMTRSWAGRGR